MARRSSSVMSRPEPNARELSYNYRVSKGFRWLGRIFVFGAFLVPLLHFASDHARIPAIASWAEDLPADFLREPRKTSRRVKSLTGLDLSVDFPGAAGKTRSARCQSRPHRMDGPWTWNFISSTGGMSGCGCDSRRANGGCWRRWRMPVSKCRSWS